MGDVHLPQRFGQQGVALAAARRPAVQRFVFTALLKAPLLFLRLPDDMPFFLCLFHNVPLSHFPMRLFLMRLALPFTRARCGAFSYAACIAAFSSFSYALCPAIFANAVCRLFLCGLRYHLRKRGVAPFLVLLVLPLSEIFPMRLFFYALRCHLRQFFLCGLHRRLSQQL